MSDLFRLTDELIERLRPFFPKSHGKPRVDDRRVLSGIIVVNRNGLRWRDAPGKDGPHKTLYNFRKHRGAVGIFARMMDGLAVGKADPQTIMFDDIHGAPLHWRLMMTVADAHDVINDPSQIWALDDQTINARTLTLHYIESEDGVPAQASPLTLSFCRQTFNRRTIHSFRCAQLLTCAHFRSAPAKNVAPAL